MAGSVSRGLRNLWHAILWQGHEVVNRGDHRLIRVPDRELGERWLTWGLREQSNKAWEAMVDAGALKLAGRDAPPVTPVQPRTVVRVERQPGRKARIVVGRADGRMRRQRAHVSQRDMLDRLYTGIFMDAPLPATGALALTCRELCRVWWTLADLGEVLLAEIGGRTIADEASLRMAACTWSAEAIEAAVSEVVSVDRERAAALLRFVTFDPPSTSSLFDQSLWWTPLVPAEHDRSHILLAPLFLGDPVRLVEYRLELGGITDQRAVKGRGRPFEAHVRTVLRDRASANGIPTPSPPAPAVARTTT